MNTYKKSTAKTGATPRQLSTRELHLELRRADMIIDTAIQFIAATDIEAFEDATIDNGLTQPDDFAAYHSRACALNRITPRSDYLKLAAFILCIALGLAWVTVQKDRDLSHSHLTQGEHQNGPVN